jgi:prephenate dehydrogenase
METVAIVGVGLIGGSFALALRQAGFSGRIVGVSSPATLAEATRLGVVEKGITLEDAVRTADLLYLAQPILQILTTIDQIAELNPGPKCLVTDAGSTKEAIVARGREKLRPGQFLGGHPMAGKELRGVASAEGDLFRDRTYVLTPARAEDLDIENIREFVSWVEKIGAVPVRMGAAEHDVTVAFTSHLPQLISTALACTLGNVLSGEQHITVSGPGLSDSTRLALSDYEIWRDILATNDKNITEALDLYIDKLSEIRQNLTDPSMYDQFRMGADTVRRFRR